MLRLTASASNIANAQSNGVVPGSRGGQAVYQPVRAELSPSAGGGVRGRLVRTDPAYRLTYGPASVHANAEGMIATPNVDMADELVGQLSARLAFEANLKLVSTVSTLERRSIDLWV
ncbi:MAG: hypothetical protein J7498_10100 [Sphingobium sp.]|nr:hypothetical protein [Sphingobium sp.]